MPSTPHPWDPAQAAASAGVEVVSHPIAALMGGGMQVWRDGRAWIVVDPALTGPERREVVTHELVHAERGGGADASGAPSTWAAVVARDETAVDEEVARRMLPDRLLAPWLARRLTAVGMIEPFEVAEEFDVPVAVARRALARLAGTRAQARFDVRG